MWVKICGVRDVDSARAVSDLRPDAIGLNFHPASPRCVDIRMAERIVRSLPTEVEPVGVFVNRTAAEIMEIAAQLRLFTVQLHGDESPSVAEELTRSGLKVIRAMRVDEATADWLPVAVGDFRSISLKGVLIDARVAGQYGGSGQSAPWDRIAAHWKPEWPSLILAGGLTPANVASAIAATRPWGVDTASGVESSPGIKDIPLVRRFIESARSASQA
jgi:phosphoribosylanthranilate isomerase